MRAEHASSVVSVQFTHTCVNSLKSKIKKKQEKVIVLSRFGLQVLYTSSWFPCVPHS